MRHKLKGGDVVILWLQAPQMSGRDGGRLGFLSPVETSQPLSVAYLYSFEIKEVGT